ncbi:MAG: hypothetical protein QOF51_547 [Chloroflexota bacterium]|jgi:hypothetical protein|nr:hypothetical protein [Chloroflexota bacterium]
MTETSAQGRVEEGVHLSPYTCEITDYLQHAFELLDAGDEDRIIGDPWFTRDDGLPPLSDEDVDRVIAAIDSEFETEIRIYASYHLNHSGANWVPEFNRLSPRARRAVVEGLDAILARYKPEAPPTSDWC